jgi:V8-like Glu-specific endopeptidase
VAVAFIAMLASACDVTTLGNPLPTPTRPGSDSPVDEPIAIPPSAGGQGMRREHAVNPVTQRPNAEWDSPPPTVPAARARHPYNAIVGKLFAHFSNESRTTYTECTATAVASTNQSTIWTSAHCLNNGKAGKFSYGEFVPAFNDRGGADPNLDPWNPDDVAPYAPYGVFTISEVWVPAGWKARYDGSGSVSNDIDGFDYGAAVVRRNAAGQTLGEAIGKAARLSFDPPLEQIAEGVTVLGYPGDAPYDGTIEYQCTQTPQVLPAPGSPGREFRIGCSMTAGSSGGPWLAQIDGDSVVIGNTSFTNGDANPSQRWLTATMLSQGAMRLYQEASTY